MAKKINVEMILTKIQESSFYQNLDYQLPTYFNDNINTIPFALDIAFKLDLDISQNLFYINFNVVYTDKENKEIVILKAEYRFTFFIGNLKDLVTIEDDKFTLKVDFVPDLFAVAAGSIRGIIFAKTAMTPLANYPMPMINMQNLFKNKKTDNK